MNGIKYTFVWIQIFDQHQCPAFRSVNEIYVSQGFISFTETKQLRTYITEKKKKNTMAQMEQ